MASSTDRHANTDRYVQRLREADNPDLEFVGIVQALVDPRLDIDCRGPVADLVDALEISRRVTR